LPASKIALLDLKTGKYRTLLEGGFEARYLPSGHLVYARPGALMAVPFDAGRGVLTGTPITVVDALEIDPTTATGYFDVADDGTLVYLPAAAATSRIVWAEPGSPPKPIAEERRGYRFPAVSPDGRRIAVSLFEQGSADVWMLDPSRGVLTRLTTSPRLEFMPRWTRDGRTLNFVSDTGAFTLYTMPADGGAAPAVLWESGFDKYPGNVSPDGRTLAFTQDNTETLGDLWLLDLDGEKRARPWLVTPFDERQPEFSPDGRFILFFSNESGQYEVYLAPIANAGAKTRLSTGGGKDACWSPDGRRIFYRNGTSLMAVDLSPGPAPVPGAPRVVLTDTNMLEGWNGFRNYDVSPDGKRFVLIEGGGPGSAPTQLNVVLNWFDELKRRVPTTRP
jgi:serine/threonine-protein kinase